jgi:hypothetical protein
MQKPARSAGNMAEALSARRYRGPILHSYKDIVGQNDYASRRAGTRRKDAAAKTQDKDSVLTADAKC